MPDEKWYVVYTKSRNEKKVADRLVKDGYIAYCPLIKTVKQWSDRKKKVTVPMFPSYVFIKIDEKRRPLVLKDPGVLNFIFWLGQPAVVRDHEIEAIKEIANHSEDVSVKELKLGKGKMLEISDGPFKGLLGKVVDLSNNVIIVFIEQLGFQVQFRYSKKHLK